MKKILRIFIILLAVTAVISQCASVFVTNTMALDSIEATKLSGEISKLSEKNMILEAQVLSYASYNSIASKAADLGFIKTSDIVSVYDPIPLAKR